MFIRNAWYVAARSAEVQQCLMPLQNAGERVGPFRAPDGAVAALEDACPHRKLPLSTGRFALAGSNPMWISRADLRLRWSHARARQL